MREFVYNIDQQDQFKVYNKLWKSKGEKIKDEDDFERELEITVRLKLRSRRS